MKAPELIGISGTALSGKDVLADYLQETFGYEHVSTGDMVREISKVQRGSIERPVLREVATQQRTMYGGDYFMKLALKLPFEKKVITGIRSLGEAKALQAAGGILLFVDVPIEIRYRRMLKRARDAETQLSLEQFTASEMAEWYDGEGDDAFNLRGIKQRADLLIDEDLGLDAFFTRASQLLNLSR